MNGREAHLARQEVDGGKHGVESVNDLVAGSEIGHEPYTQDCCPKVDVLADDLQQRRDHMVVAGSIIQAVPRANGKCVNQSVCIRKLEGNAMEGEGVGSSPSRPHGCVLRTWGKIA